MQTTKTTKQMGIIFNGPLSSIPATNEIAIKTINNWVRLNNIIAN
jgi:hypothetical protein